jgi:hypothetical protein
MKNITKIMKPKIKKGYIEYESCNPGGKYPLKDDDWKNLESAGWVVNWHKRNYLGQLATSARIYGLTELEAKESWEKATGKDSTGWGCGCGACSGLTHEFFEYDENGEEIY